MASSNRHWPSLFKSKPSCTAAHHQWQHDINNSSLISGHACQKPNSYVSGAEERTPEPKPRWNPKPEQIRILEAIFNSGMVNPPRDEIRRIRAQLQVYGQVGDANVFYWFQNRKSRSKHKQRHLKTTSTTAAAAAALNSTSPSSAPTDTAPPPAATSSSSSSSDRSTSSSDKQIMHVPSVPPLSTAAASGLAAFFDLSQTPSVNQSFFHSPLLMQPELNLENSLFLPGSISSTYPLPAPELSGSIAPVSPALWGDLFMQGAAPIKHSVREEDEVVEFNNKFGVLGSLASVTDSASLSPAAAGANVTTANIATPPGALSDIQASRSTVFINEVAYEVMPGPLNIRAAFGDNVVLLHSSGHPVLTDEWGLTLHPLQHGGSYYLVQ